jgi:hypothetical protein
MEGGRKCMCRCSIHNERSTTVTITNQDGTMVGQEKKESSSNVGYKIGGPEDLIYTQRKKMYVLEVV